MNISKEQIDELNALVKVKLGPEDYEARVEGTLKDYSKKVSMPGFRPGKVPMGMVKKMYGKSVLADELNKILNDSLYKYLKDENLEILGNPLPSDTESPLDFENQKEFEFIYEIGLAPRFDVSLSEKDKFTYYTVRIDETLVDKYVQDLSRRYGKLVNPEVSAAGDWLTGDLTELDAAGEILAGGVFKQVSVFTERLKGEKLKNLLQGKKAEEKLMLSPEIWEENEDLDYFMKISGQESDAGKTKSYALSLKSINRMEGAEINQELFDKIYGENRVNSVEEFRARVRQDLERMFAGDSDTKFRNEVRKTLLNRLSLSLPDKFLKRWIISINEKPITPQQVEEEYPTYSDQLKWQLIENKILKENEIKISSDEAIEYVKELVRAEYMKMGRTDVSDNELAEVSKRVLEKEEEAKKIFDQLYDRRLLQLYKEKCTLEPKEVSYEEFVTI